MTEPAHPHNGKLLAAWGRHLLTLIVVTFGFGVWCTRLQKDLDTLQIRVEKLESKSIPWAEERIVKLENQMEIRIEERNEIKDHRKSLDAVWGRVKELEKKP